MVSVLLSESNSNHRQSGKSSANRWSHWLVGLLAFEETVIYLWLALSTSSTHMDPFYQPVNYVWILWKEEYKLSYMVFCVTMCKENFIMQ